ncbi:hypothetical protein Acr_29g0007260 [Actinidia rufa]|uniref:Uncharacterized protein n=1 Tax=Actinidia rufa TaxID=165716 RepID=A0A7J0HG06_9ERIC|nr:hypothetical protein Acr_29g0007260 [Actinidia rufa]
MVERRLKRWPWVAMVVYVTVRMSEMRLRKRGMDNWQSAVGKYQQVSATLVFEFGDVVIVAMLGDAALGWERRGGDGSPSLSLPLYGFTTLFGNNKEG